MTAIIGAAAVNSSYPEECPSLFELSIKAYVEFLEEECAAYVSLTHLDSPFLNPVKDRLMAKLKRHLKASFENYPNPASRRDHSCVIRTLLIHFILNGRYPSEHHQNYYNYNAHRNSFSTLGDDDDSVAKELESIKLNGRKCSSVCCTGAFLVETMLCVLVNEDIMSLEFGKNIKDKIYQDKPISTFMFFDLPSILVHYIMALNDSPEDYKPPLQKLILESSNLGSLANQSLINRMLRSYKETRKYIDFPWKLSMQHSRPSTQFMMLTLGVMFDRPPGYFQSLKHIKLSGECLHTRLNVSKEVNGQAPAHLMSCIAQSCPNLKVFDLSDLASLSPECLIYLCYKDAFHVLHKYMYLEDVICDNSVGKDVFDDHSIAKKHDGTRYCPWCEDPSLESGFRSRFIRDTSNSIFILDDRLYEYIETVTSSPNSSVEGAESGKIPSGSYLNFCVKISDLFRALTDDEFVLDREDHRPQHDDEPFALPESASYTRKPVDRERFGLSDLCYSIKELRLPSDLVDSKAWIVPLFLTCMPNLKSLGNCQVYDGLQIMNELPEIPSPERTNFEVLELCLEDSRKTKVHERITKCLKSLVANFPLWSAFCNAGASPTRLRNGIEISVENFVKDKFPQDRIIPDSDIESVKKSWATQIKTVAECFPKLRSLHLTIQPSVLSEADKSVLWRPLSVGLARLSELHISGSCWADVAGLLLMVGHKLEVLDLSLTSPKSVKNDDICSTEYINTIPHLCPNLTKVSLGPKQGDQPHSLCSSDLYTDEDRMAYKSLVHFEASGSITYSALCFLWQRANSLQTLRIANNIVLEVGDFESSLQPRFTEVVLSPDRIDNLFCFNKMNYLRVLDAPMTFSSIASAKKLLNHLPPGVKEISLLQVKVAIPESGEGNESIGDLVASVLREMVEFKLMCKRRCAEQQCKIRWTWRREGILTILLQQQIMASITELIDP